MLQSESRDFVLFRTFICHGVNKFLSLALLNPPVVLMKESLFTRVFARNFGVLFMAFRTFSNRRSLRSDVRFHENTFKRFSFYERKRLA